MKPRTTLLLIAAAVIAVGLAGWQASCHADPQTEKAASAVRVSPEDAEVAEALSRVFRAVVEGVQPSVVFIGTETKSQAPEIQTLPGPWGNPDLERLFPQPFQQNPHAPQGRRPTPRPERGLGSGFIISSDGWIVTNNHVVSGADKVWVKLLDDDEEYVATETRRDPKTDIAVIKIEVDRELPAISFGDSETLQVGDWVMAFGNPLGLSHTVSRGVVSAKDRQGVFPRQAERPQIFYERFIQTDAAINQGNSGGPLVNMRGEVVGVNTLIATPYNIGIGFAIPSDLAQFAAENLIETGEVVRGWLGVEMQAWNPELREYFGVPEGGVLVGNVLPDNPADKAGIKPLDVLLEFDGTELRDRSHLQGLAANTPPGKNVKVLLRRDGKDVTVTVEIGKQKDEEEMVAGGPPQGPRGALGVTVENLSEAQARALGMEKPQGVIITDIDPDGPAMDAGLEPGMVVLEIDRRPIASVGDFVHAVEAAPKDKGVLLKVKTRSGEFYTVLNPVAE